MRALTCIAFVAGCYSPPQPTCGFVCGNGGACPDGYTCNARDSRCHLDGTEVMCDGSPGPGAGLTLMPPNGDVDVTVAPVIEVRFDSPIVHGDPAGLAVTANGMVVAGVTDAPLGGFDVDFRANDQLPPKATIEVTLPPTIFSDHTPGGVTWRFTTGPDDVPPRPVELAPEAVNAPPQTTVSVRFDEDVFDLDVTSFLLFAGVELVPAFVDYDPVMHRATLVPDPGPLANDTRFTARITQAVRDRYGNASGFFWQFVTAPSFPAPSLLSTSPANNDTNVDVGSAIIVVFDENVIGVDATSFALDHAITGTVTATDATATFTPSAPLPAATTITATLSTAITDLDGNPLLSPVTFSFTTL
jgi:hypothetical protein